jgi:hypothetical protein
LGTKKIASGFSFSSVFKFSGFDASASAPSSVPVASVDVDGGSDGLDENGCGDSDGYTDVTSLVAVGPPPVQDLYLGEYAFCFHLGLSFFLSCALPLSLSFSPSSLPLSLSRRKE